MRAFAKTKAYGPRPMVNLVKLDAFSPLLAGFGARRAVVVKVVQTSG